MTRFSTALALLAACTLVDVTPAQEAWGTNVLAQQLFEVDLTTGNATLIGSTGREVTALAHDPNTDTLYGISRFPGELVTVNRTTGATTLVGPLGMERVAAGAAFDKNTNTLYMVDFVNSSNLWEVDTTTGAATIIGAHGIDVLQGLAFDPNTSTLYASKGGGTGNTGLYTIDTTTGAPTFIGSYGSTEVWDHGLGFDESTGTLYLAQANSAVNNVYVVDPNTAALTTVGSLNTSIQGFDIEGLAVGPIGTNYCGPANQNSSGQSAVIAAVGDESVANNSVRLDASQMATNEFGYFINSMTQGFVIPPGSQGNLCLGGAIGRHTANVMSTGAGGAFSLQLDLNAVPTPGGDVAINAGETWYWQAWFRDNNPGPTNNFTDGICITFQ